MLPYGVLYAIRLGSVATGCAYQTPGASSVDLPHGMLFVGASKFSSWAFGDLCLHLDVAAVRFEHVAIDLGSLHLGLWYCCSNLVRQAASGGPSP